MSLRFCPKCGGKLDEEVEFCSFCGADLRERKAKEKGVAPTTRTVAPSQEVPSAPPEKVSEPVKTEISQKKIAGILPRISAWLLDLLVIAGISFIALIFLQRLGPIFLLIIVPLIAFFYYWILEIITDGQTLGKKALSLRTVNAKTLEPANPGNYLVNNLLKCSPLLILDLIIGLLANLNNPNKRLRIMQNASNTVVIRTK